MRAAASSPTPSTRPQGRCGVPSGWRAPRCRCIARPSARRPCRRPVRRRLPPLPSEETPSGRSRSRLLVIGSALALAVAGTVTVLAAERRLGRPWGSGRSGCRHGPDHVGGHRHRRAAATRRPAAAAPGLADHAARRRPASPTSTPPRAPRRSPTASATCSTSAATRCGPGRAGTPTAASPRSTWSPGPRSRGSVRRSATTCCAWWASRPTWMRTTPRRSRSSPRARG